MITQEIINSIPPGSKLEKKFFYDYIHAITLHQKNKKNDISWTTKNGGKKLAEAIARKLLSILTRACDHQDWYRYNAAAFYDEIKRIKDILQEIDYKGHEDIVRDLNILENDLKNHIKNNFKNNSGDNNNNNNKNTAVHTRGGISGKSILFGSILVGGVLLAWYKPSLFQDAKISDETSKKITKKAIKYGAATVSHNASGFWNKFLPSLGIGVVTSAAVEKYANYESKDREEENEETTVETLSSKYPLDDLLTKLLKEEDPNYDQKVYVFAGEGESDLNKMANKYPLTDELNKILEDDNINNNNNIPNFS